MDDINKIPVPYYFEWVDATHDSGWSEIEKCENKCSLIYSVGFVVKEDAEFITITSSVDSDFEEACGILTVPVSWIRKRKPIIY
jgi:hypothetical protein